MLSTFWKIQCILGNRHILGSNFAYGNFHYVEVPMVGRSTRMHCIYQNLDNDCHCFMIIVMVKKLSCFADINFR